MLNSKYEIIEMLEALKNCISDEDSSNLLMITTMRDLTPDSVRFVIDKAIEALKAQ